VITLIGVGHVFNIGHRVEEIIRERGPDLVCVELDRARYHALRTKERGDLPLQYKMMAAFQNRLAKKYGAEAGDEMLSAVRAGRSVNAKIAFIDMDAQKILASLWGDMSFKERFKLFFASIYGLFVSKKKVERELERFHTSQEQYFQELETSFPELKRMLIDDRNEHMAGNINRLSERYSNIIAVVGEGHIPGLRPLLQDRVEIIGLEELRSGSKRQDAPGDGSSAQISFTYKYPDN
jgi:pheromone shutdown protein TraB